MKIRLNRGTGSLLRIPHPFLPFYRPLSHPTPSIPSELRFIRGLFSPPRTPLHIRMVLNEYFLCIFPLLLH